MCLCEKQGLIRSAKSIIKCQPTKSVQDNMSRNFLLFVNFLHVPGPLYPQCINNPSPKQQILDSSKLKKFADDDFKFEENGRKFSQGVENTEGIGEIGH